MNLSLLSMDSAPANVSLQLYVAGTGPRSMRAVERVTRLCQEHLHGRYRLDVIDIYQQPAKAEEGQVVAVPTLVRSAPTPVRQLIGDLADEARLLRALGVQEAA